MPLESAAVETMSIDDRKHKGGLRVARVFHDFVEQELLPEIGFKSDEFWQGLEAIVTSLTPTNRALLARRDELQHAIDAWHESHTGSSWSHDEYVDFLKEYWLPAGRRRAVLDRNRERRCRDRRDGWSAIGGAGQQRTLRGQRRERALGQSLRCAVRYRRYQ